MIAKTTKILAIATIVMSIPLLLTYNVKYQKFPEGLLYFLLFFWWLLSFWVVPVLTLVGVVLTVSFVTSSDGSRRILWRWSLPGVLVGLAAEVIVVLLSALVSVRGR
jgi:hypothetical protein